MPRIVKNIFGALIARVTKSPGRSKEAMKNIILSLASKAISILSSLLIVPLTIDYVNPTQYGIWMTVSSIIGWIGFFDLGLGNGFRNRFAEARAKGDNELASMYLSTSYFFIGVIVAIVFIVIYAANAFIDWSAILNVKRTYSTELGNVFIILSAFFCFSMVARLVGTMLTADQRVGVSSMIQGGGQLLSLAAIFILTKVSKGSLTNLAIYFAGIPCVVWMLSSVVVYLTPRYSYLVPRLKNVRLSLVNDIMGLGIQFFVIHLCLILVFQIVNVVISRELGPEAVTEYNIAYKYFNILNNVAVIVLTPFWSAFTDAYQKEDYVWMQSTLSNLEKLWLVGCLVSMIMLALSQPFYRLWVGNEVEVSFLLSLAVAVYFITYNLGNIYMYLINGIGKIRIQLIVYVAFAIVAWPLMVWASRSFGLCGVVIVPSSVLLVQAILGRIQLMKLLTKSAKGIWAK